MHSTAQNTKIGRFVVVPRLLGWGAPTPEPNKGPGCELREAWQGKSWAVLVLKPALTLKQIAKQDASPAGSNEVNALLASQAQEASRRWFKDKAA